MTIKISSKDKFPVTTDGVPYDVDATFPDAETEVYEYSLLGVIVKTVTVIYYDSTKEEILSIRWT